MAILGFALIVALAARGLSAAVLLGMLAMTVLGWLTGTAEFKGVLALPPDPTPLLFALDIQGALSLSMLTTILTLLLVDVFDTAGTLVAVAERSGIVRPDGSLPRLRAALLADSSATALGALGTSSTTSFIERAGRGLPPGGGRGSQPLPQACSSWLASSSRHWPRACPPLPRPRRFFLWPA